jgi:hypothetical protein
MHSMPYLIQNSAGVWCVQHEVPEKLQAAVARILGRKKPTQVYLKKPLATKDRREATRRATHALADIDRKLREAEALTQKPKVKAALRTKRSVKCGCVRRGMKQRRSSVPCRTRR